MYRCQINSLTTMFRKATKFLVIRYCRYHQSLTESTRSKFPPLHSNILKGLTANLQLKRPQLILNRSILGITGDILRQPALDLEHRAPYINLKSHILGKYAKDVQIKQNQTKISFNAAGKIRKFARNNRNLSQIKIREFSDSSKSTPKKHCAKAKPCKKPRRKKASDSCKKSPEEKEKATEKRYDPCKKHLERKKKEVKKICCPYRSACKRQPTCSPTEATKDRCRKAVVCKKKDPCAKEDPCKKKREDPCKKKEVCPKGKCPEKVDPCKVTRGDPCKKKNDKCK